MPLNSKGDCAKCKRAVKQQRWGVVAQQPEESNGGFTFTVIRVLMACDECDTPWIEVPHA